MRHSSLDLTFGAYGHLLPDTEGDAVAGLDEFQPTNQPTNPAPLKATAWSMKEGPKKTLRKRCRFCSYQGAKARFRVQRHAKCSCRTTRKTKAATR